MANDVVGAVVAAQCGGVEGAQLHWDIHWKPIDEILDVRLDSSLVQLVDPRPTSDLLGVVLGLSGSSFGMKLSKYAHEGKEIWVFVNMRREVGENIALRASCDPEGRVEDVGCLVVDEGTKNGKLGLKQLLDDDALSVDVGL